MSLPLDNIWDYDQDVTIGLYPDAHVKPGHDQRPVAAIAKWFAHEGVDLIINIGDFSDMPSLSSYAKGKAEIEGKRIATDLAYTDEMLDHFNYNLYGHQCDKIITLGNHEERLDRLQSDEPQLEGAFGDDPFSYHAHGYYVYDYLDIVRVNGVSFSHAFINPTSLMGTIQGGSADIRMKNIGFPHVAGHQHGPLIHGQRMLGDGTPLSTLILGCAHTENHSYWGKGKDVYRGAAVLRNVRNGSYDPDIRYLGNIIRDFL
jgi:hypothetical protein